ncbi:MAG: hypothetical protein IKM87_06580 [Clostridia bacterium]|nr:hypothetical protein [Clostridia bacterium]MBR6822811.1 hypothetical protein [Clostridia bacterium]
MEIRLKVAAKINLSLDIIGKLESGYHEIDSVMQSVSVFDYVSIATAEKDIISYDEAASYSPVKRAAEAFFQRSGIGGGARIGINRTIPVASGMGGSSADASCVLYGLNELYSHPLGNADLLDIAVSLGADMSFMLFGGTKRCRGIGERLTDVKNLTDPFYLGVKAQGFITSKEAYQAFDSIGESMHGDMERVIGALETGLVENGILYNVLEGPCMTLAPDILNVKEIFSSDRNCRAHFLTGSGPMYVGIYDSFKEASDAMIRFPGREKHIFRNEDRSIMVL